MLRIAPFIRFPIDRPRATLLLVALACAAVFWPLPELRFAQEDVTDLDPDDPEIRYLREFNERFGDDEVLLLAIEAEDAFAPEALSHLKQVTREVALLPTVERVHSLFTEADFVAEGGEVRSEVFLKDVPSDAAQLADKRARALANEGWTGFLVSKDGTLATVSAVLRKDNGAVPHRAETAERIREIGERDLPPGMTAHLAGRGAVFLDAMTAMRGEFLRSLWLTPLWVTAVLVFVFRSRRGVLLPLAVCGLAVAATLALYLRCGNPLGMMTLMLPMQIAVICLSDVIHILAHQQENLEKGEPGAKGWTPRDALVRTMQFMAPACFFTMATSAIGFLSFTTAGLASLASFGSWTAAGIGIAFVVAMTVLPALLSLLPPRPRELEGRVRLENPVSATLIAIGVRLLRCGRKGRRALGASWVVLIAIAIAGMFRLEVDSDFTRSLPADSKASRAAKVLQHKLAGTATLEVVLEGEPLAFEEPWAIAALDRVDRFLRERPEVDKTFSVADFLRRLHAERAGAAGLELPQDGATLSEYFFVLDGSRMLDRFVTPDRSAARLSVRLGAHSTKGPEELVAAVEGLRPELDPRLRLRTTGVSKLFAQTANALVTGQTRSLFTSLLWVSLVLVLAVRSLRVGVIALIPNVAPIVLTLGAMGWCGVSLDVMTIMVGAIALGIAVDDTIHLITRHGAERRVATKGALERALRTAGHPAIFTSLLFAGAFGSLCLSSFPPMRAFGALSAFAMIAAMFSDLTLLPLLLGGPSERGERGEAGA